MAVAPSSRYTVVRGLARGLNVLRALSERPPAAGAPRNWPVELGIHRTTLKRLCETLRELHYVSLDTEHRSLQPHDRDPQSGRRVRDDDALIVAAQRILPDRSRGWSGRYS